MEPSSTSRATPHSQAVSDYPLVQATRSGSLDNESTEWVRYKPCVQYPRTLCLLQEMMAGERDSFRAPFRCRWSDGFAYEAPCDFWVVETQWAQRADGSRWRRPSTYVTAASVDSCVRVDEELSVATD